MATGFVRIAIEQQAALVPIVVLGEVDCLRNFVDAPHLQAWSYKKLGFPVSIQWSLLQSSGLASDWRPEAARMLPLASNRSCLENSK